MTAVFSPTPASPVTSPRPTPSPSSNANLSTLPPLNTTHPPKRSKMPRPTSYAQNRMSSYSTTSNMSQKPSRPPSSIFPTFHSSLPYAMVRDFAYPLTNPLHYGPPAEASAAQSGRSTPAPDLQRRLSDPPGPSWETSKLNWAGGPWGGDGNFGNEQLPQMAYAEERGGRDHGPPYSEDEDLMSPVVVSSRHKKIRSAMPSILGTFGRGRGRSPGRNTDTRQPNSGGNRSYYTGTNGDGSETYYISEADETADGPGGEIVTYPPDQARQSNPTLFPNTYHSPRNATELVQTPQRKSMFEDSNLEPGSFGNESRYSRDYQFTIASPDEEMHGKAVALFDFARENENELPLVEGQVIWVSYRHGQGWLVAEDPKTRESGLVPEEYVRLLRDIEGGWTSLSGAIATDDQTGLLSPEPQGADPANAVTPTATDPGQGHSAQNSSGINITGAEKEKRAPIVSSFSTSSNDLKPYSHPLLGTQKGQQPPQVVHYGSQSTTPTVLSPIPAATYRPDSKDGTQPRRTDGGRIGDPAKSSDEESDDRDEDEEDETSSEEEEAPRPKPKR